MIGPEYRVDDAIYSRLSIMFIQPGFDLVQCAFFGARLSDCVEGQAPITKGRLA